MRVRLMLITLAGTALMAARTWAQETQALSMIAELEQIERVRHQLLQRPLPIAPPPPPPTFPAIPAPPDVPAFSAEQRGAAAQTERFSRKIKLERNGSVSVSNVSGEIVVTGGSGDEVSIEATKWTNADKGQLAEVQIEVDQRAGRIDVRTNYPRRNFNFFSARVSVDYAITVPTWAAVDVHSVSGVVKVTAVQGAVRAVTVNGDITTSATSNLELAKTVSGDIDLTGATASGDLEAGSVSGHVRAKSLKARSLDITTVSGDVNLTDVICDRLVVKTVSGNLEYSGALVGGGRYDVNTFSGSVRLALSSGTGFELNADTFSGAIRSEMPLTVGGDTRADVRQRGRGRSIRAVSGNGSAILTIRTFSGNIVIAKP